MSEKDVELLAEVTAIASRIRAEVAKKIVGQTEAVDSMLIALLCRSHALLVGVPGLAKTLLVSTLAQSLGLSFGRVQFTPDLLPSDITGTDVIEETPSGKELRFLRGPIFANLILADEINRTPPKTQSALLQAMQERQVTTGRTTHDLPDPFLVFATRNPIEQEGTYVLPEAQRDRFLLEVHMTYPTEEQEREVTRRTTGAEHVEIGALLTEEKLREVLSLVPRVPIMDSAVDFAVRLARRSRPENSEAPAKVKKYVRFGAGPRGSQALALAAKAHAILSGEAAAQESNVRAVAKAVLRHRIVLGFRAEADGVSDLDIVNEVLS